MKIRNQTMIDFIGRESSKIFSKQTGKEILNETKKVFVSFENFIKKEYFIIIVVFLVIIALIQLYLIFASLWDLSPFFYDRKDISNGNSIFFV